MTRTRALIIDDDTRIGALIKRVLDRLDVDARLLGDPDRFAEVYAATSPDVIFLELQMEGTDGVAVIRELARLRSRSLIIITTGLDARVLAAARALGESLGLELGEPLRKPLELSAVRARLGRFLARAETLAPDTSPLTRAELSRAIGASELVTYYQPWVELPSGRLAGVEALARWRHPRHGLVAPDRFIPLAESSGLIGAVTTQVMTSAIREAAAWRRTNPDLALAVNLSRGLLESLDLPDRVAEVLARFDFPPEKLTLEVTERPHGEDVDLVTEILARLRIKGVRLAIDDFGKGSSTLDQLYRLPFDVLKIDKAFVMEMPRREEATAIVRSTIELARTVGVEVIAEGVENHGIYERLAREGCHGAQGTFVAAPLEPSRFCDWAGQWRRTGARGTGATRRPAGEPPARSQRRALPAGHRLHWYRIDSVIGQGGFGITYLARDTNLSQSVAIKEYMPRALAHRTAGGAVSPASTRHADTYEWGRNGFITEARTLARFRHPNIVRVLSVFEAHGTAYMVMEYEQGQSLEEVLGRGRIEAEEDLLRLVFPLVDGLALVHQCGFIHRDIKPGNIFLRADGTPVLLDFGSARPAPAGEARPLTTLVTPGYAPIEQYHIPGHDASEGPWTDIYSLGATLYRAIAGEAPADAVTRARALLAGEADHYEPVARRCPAGYSQAMLTAVNSALSLWSEERPRSVLAWAAMLPEPPAPAYTSTPTVRVPEPCDASRHRASGPIVAPEIRAAAS